MPGPLLTGADLRTLEDRAHARVIIDPRQFAIMLVVSASGFRALNEGGSAQFWHTVDRVQRLVASDPSLGRLAGPSADGPAPADPPPPPAA